MGDKKEPITNWFIEPEDAHTNEVIARNLRAINQVDESFAVKDDSGHDHSVYQVGNYSFITQIYKDRGKFQLRFQVFYRKGKNGPLRLWELGDKKKISAKVRKTKVPAKSKN